MLMFSKLAGLLTVALLGLLIQQIAAAEVAESPKSKVVGKYAYASEVEDANMEKLLTVIGFSEGEKATVKQLAPKTTKEITMSGTEITIKVITPVNTVGNAFENGKEYQETLVNGKQVKSKVTIEDTKLTFIKSFPTGFDLTEVLDCDDKGCNDTLSAKGATATIRWKRI